MIKLVVLAALAWLAWRWLKKPLPRPSGAAAQARALLELPKGANADAIRAAHRRIVARVHPDTGGSAELTRRVNEARDILLAQLNRTPGGAL